MQKTYIKSLDGVRAIAILLVMAFHFGIIRFGWLGVQLFFVLSGYLISGILLKEKNQVVPLGQRLKQFWIRRSLRIFPVYYLYLLFFLLIYLLTDFPSYYGHDLPYLLTYTFNLTRMSAGWHESPIYTHFWSLCVEEQFYLFFPFVIFLFSVTTLKRLTAAVLILTPVFRGLFAYYLVQTGKSSFEVSDIIYWFPLSHLDAFFAGMAIHLLQLTIRVKQPQWLFAAMLIIAAGAGIFNYRLDNHGQSFPISLGYNFGDIAQYQHIWYYTVLNLSFSSLLLLLVTENTSRLSVWIQTIMENKILVAIGKVSYGMYIFHWAIQTQVIGKYIPITDSNKYWLFVLYIPIVYLCAWLSFQLIEKKFIHLKDKLAPSKVQVKLSCQN